MNGDEDILEIKQHIGTGENKNEKSAFEEAMEVDNETDIADDNSIAKYSTSDVEISTTEDEVQKVNVVTSQTAKARKDELNKEQNDLPKPSPVHKETLSSETNIIPQCAPTSSPFGIPSKSTPLKKRLTSELRNSQLFETIDNLKSAENVQASPKVCQKTNEDHVKVEKCPAKVTTKEIEIENSTVEMASSEIEVHKSPVKITEEISDQKSLSIVTTNEVLVVKSPVKATAKETPVRKSPVKTTSNETEMLQSKVKEVNNEFIHDKKIISKDGVTENTANIFKDHEIIHPFNEKLNQSLMKEARDIESPVKETIENASKSLNSIVEHNDDVSVSNTIRDVDEKSIEQTLNASEAVQSNESSTNLSTILPCASEMNESIHKKQSDNVRRQTNELSKSLLRKKQNQSVFLPESDSELDKSTDLSGNNLSFNCSMSSKSRNKFDQSSEFLPYDKEDFEMSNVISPNVSTSLAFNESVHGNKIILSNDSKEMNSNKISDSIQDGFETLTESVTKHQISNIVIEKLSKTDDLNDDIEKPEVNKHESSDIGDLQSKAEGNLHASYSKNENVELQTTRVSNLQTFERVNRVDNFGVTDKEFDPNVTRTRKQSEKLIIPKNVEEFNDQMQQDTNKSVDLNKTETNMIRFKAEQSCVENQIEKKDESKNDQLTIPCHKKVDSEHKQLSRDDSTQSVCVNESGVMFDDLNDTTLIEEENEDSDEKQNALVIDEKSNDTDQDVKLECIVSSPKKQQNVSEESKSMKDANKIPASNSETALDATVTPVKESKTQEWGTPMSMRRTTRARTPSVTADVSIGDAVGENKTELGTDVPLRKTLRRARTPSITGDTSIAETDTPTRRTLRKARAPSVTRADTSIVDTVVVEDKTQTSLSTGRSLRRERTPSIAADTSIVETIKNETKTDTPTRRNLKSRTPIVGNTSITTETDLSTRRSSRRARTPSVTSETSIVETIAEDNHQTNRSVRASKTRTPVKGNSSIVEAAQEDNVQTPSGRRRTSLRQRSLSVSTETSNLVETQADESKISPVVSRRMSLRKRTPSISSETSNLEPILKNVSQSTPSTRRRRTTRTPSKIITPSQLETQSVESKVTSYLQNQAQMNELAEKDSVSTTPSRSTRSAKGRTPVQNVTEDTTKAIPRQKSLAQDMNKNASYEEDDEEDDKRSWQHERTRMYDFNIESESEPDDNSIEEPINFDLSETKLIQPNFVKTPKSVKKVKRKLSDDEGEATSKEENADNAPRSSKKRKRQLPENKSLSKGDDDEDAKSDQKEDSESKQNVEEDLVQLKLRRKSKIFASANKKKQVKPTPPVSTTPSKRMKFRHTLAKIPEVTEKQDEEIRNVKEEENKSSEKQLRRTQSLSNQEGKHLFKESKETFEKDVFERDEKDTDTDGGKTKPKVGHVNTTETVQQSTRFGTKIQAIPELLYPKKEKRIVGVKNEGQEESVENRHITIKKSRDKNPTKKEKSVEKTEYNKNDDTNDTERKPVENKAAVSRRASRALYAVRKSSAMSDSNSTTSSIAGNVSKTSTSFMKKSLLAAVSSDKLSSFYLRRRSSRQSALKPLVVLGSEGEESEEIEDEEMEEANSSVHSTSTDKLAEQNVEEEDNSKNPAPKDQKVKSGNPVPKDQIDSIDQKSVKSSRSTSAVNVHDETPKKTFARSTRSKKSPASSIVSGSVDDYTTAGSKNKRKRVQDDSPLPSTSVQEMVTKRRLTRTQLGLISKNAPIDDNTSADTSMLEVVSEEVEAAGGGSKSSKRTRRK